MTRVTESFEHAWTFFGYKGESEEIRVRCIRHANLMGPAGFVSVDDSEMMKFSQDGVRPWPEVNGILEMGGRDWKTSEPHVVTESLIRSFYDYYRRVMDL